MRKIYSSDYLTLQSVGTKDPQFHVVIVEDREEAVLYDERTGKSEGLTGELYQNIVDDLSNRLGMGMVLTVATVSTAEVAHHEDRIFRKVEKIVRKQDEAYPFSDDQTGYIIASKRLANTLSTKWGDYLNVILPNKTDTEEFGIRLPFDSDSKWTISVPTPVWSRVGGSVKDDGAGINLLGFIIRAVECLVNGQTEGSIYQQMAAYHAGKFGEIVYVDTIEKFDSMMARLRASSIVSLDTEGVSLARVGGTLLSIQFVSSKKDTSEVDRTLKMHFLPMYHDQTPWTSREIKYVKRKLKRYFEDQCEGQLHMYQFAKFDVHQFMNAFKLRYYAADVYDTSAGSFSLEENQKVLKSINISAYGLEHLERCMEYNRPADLVIAKADRSRMAEFSLDDIMRYGVIDVLTVYFIGLEQIRIAEARGYPNFEQFMRKQMGPMILAMTTLEHNGIPVDMEYLENIASPLGELANMIRESAQRIMETEAAKKANSLLLEETSYQKQGMFGTVKEPQLFNIRKTAHLQTMFFDVMGLEPISSKADGSGSLGKSFQNTYRHTTEVRLYTEYQKLNKLKTAFADAIYEYMETHMDMMDDKRLRPVFTYLDVLTGRSSTVKPSTQQIPTHGPKAKIIKGQFSVRKKRGRVLGKVDFSGHEVRVSGNLSDDEAICGVVDQVNEAQYRYRVADHDKLADAKVYMDENGDLHVLNFQLFFDTKISKKDPRRQDAKTAVFSVSYGAKEGSVSRKMLEEALTSAEDAMVKETDPALRKKYEKQVRYLKSEEGASDYKDKARELLKVLAKKWCGLTEYIDDLNARVAVEHVNFGPHGRPRHLWGHLSPDKFAKFAMDRRGFNSESQGYASDIGYVSIYLMGRMKYKMFDSRGYKTDMMQCNAVHDSATTDMAFQFLPLYTYLQEHAMVTQAEKYYKKHFGIKTRSHYGFDLEAGVSEAEMIEWNKRPADLVSFVEAVGKNIEMDKSVRDAALRDAETFGKLRLKELKSNSLGYRMTLLDDEVYEKIVPNLKCWGV